MGLAAIWIDIERWVRRRPKMPSAAQREEAERLAQTAARREEADEVMRATSRRVMREMWPPRGETAGRKT